MMACVGMLEVLLGEAEGIQNNDFLGQGCNPVWNERLRFKVEFDPTEPAGTGKLVVRIMDKDTFSSDDFVGEATIYVEDLVANGAENGSCELHPCKYRVVAADGLSYFGEIKIGLTFTLTEDENEEYGGWKESEINY